MLLEGGASLGQLFPCWEERSREQPNGALHSVGLSFHLSLRGSDEGGHMSWSWCRSELATTCGTNREVIANSVGLKAIREQVDADVPLHKRVDVVALETLTLLFWCLCSILQPSILFDELRQWARYWIRISELCLQDSNLWHFFQLDDQQSCGLYLILIRHCWFLGSIEQLINITEISPI